MADDGEDKPLREIENDLMELFDYEHHDLVRKLISNKDKVVWLTRLAKEEDAEAREAIEREMVADGHRDTLDELRGREGRAGADGGGLQAKKLKLDLNDLQVPSAASGAVAKGDAAEGALVGGLQPRRLINLESLVFDQGNHLMTNPNVKLPQGSH